MVWLWDVMMDITSNELVTDGEVSIKRAHCLHCGRCYEICSQKVILKRGW